MVSCSNTTIPFLGVSVNVSIGVIPISEILDEEEYNKLDIGGPKFNWNDPDSGFTHPIVRNGDAHFKLE